MLDQPALCEDFGEEDGLKELPGADVQGEEWSRICN